MRDTALLDRCCPFCGRVLRWTYYRKALDGAPECPAHGLVRMWRITERAPRRSGHPEAGIPADLILGIGHLYERGRLLKKKAPYRPVDLARGRRRWKHRDQTNAAKFRLAAEKRERWIEWVRARMVPA